MTSLPSLSPSPNQISVKHIFVQRFVYIPLEKPENLYFPF